MRRDEQQATFCEHRVDLEDRLPRHREVLERRDRVDGVERPGHEARQFMDVAHDVDVRPRMNVEADVLSVAPEAGIGSRPARSELEYPGAVSLVHPSDEVGEDRVVGVVGPGALQRARSCADDLDERTATQALERLLHRSPIPASSHSEPLPGVPGHPARILSAVAVPLDLPAIAGGQAVRGEHRLDFAPPALGDEERANVLHSLETGWLTTGPFARLLESEFALYAEAPIALAVSSCTAAMYLALRALGIGDADGDEVITTPLTWPATANVIVRAGARPVFCDVDEATLCLDPAAVAAAVTPRTRAVMPVHYAGHPCDLNALEATCAQHGLRLVEDAAHATETRLADGRKVGSVGDITCFSFYANKNLAAGEGGMLTLRDEELGARIASLRQHGLTRDSWKRYERKGPGSYDVLEPGYKLNLSDLHAGVGLGQLHRISEHHARRAAQAERYDAGLAGLPGITPLGRRLGAAGVHGWHIYVVRIAREGAGADRDAYAEALGEEGIGTGLHFLPVHGLTYFRESHPTAPLPVAEAAGAEVLSLPLSPAHTLSDVDDVVAAVRRLHAHFTR